MRWVSRPAGRRHRSLAGRLFVMQIIVVAAVVAGGAVLAYLYAAESTEEAARRQVTAVAASVADSPAVVAAVENPDPSRVLQPYAERIRRDTGVAFVTIMSPAGIRYTHPNPQMIGRPFLGHTEPALAGRAFTETFTGTLGPSVRSVAPVFDRAHRVAALVSTGITVRILDRQVRDQLLALVLLALLALGVGGAGTYFVNARLRRHTHGMDAAQLSRMYEYHNAILHTVREGLLLLDPHARIALANGAARELLRLPEDVEERAVDELPLPESLRASLSSGGPCVDEIHVTREHVVVVNKSAVTSGTRDLGSVVTLRDHTELQALSGELDSVRGFAESLRSQTHEAANRLHTVVSLIELGRPEEAIRFATAELELTQRLTDRVVGAVAEPVLAALLLGKAAQANERGVELVVTPDTEIDDTAIPETLGSRDLVTILGNLIDNAVDAAMEAGGDAPRVFVTARVSGDRLLLRVADTGGGVEVGAAEEIFERGWSTKDGARPARRGLGLALVAQVTGRHGGRIEVGREVGAVFTVTLPLTRKAMA
ncbi:sensor histidine kinase [Actinoallomurus rhizosphaericola]|uniref:sensor histidine kinase n=1 Tax=Actinoallomurus rhizosphaericola TaxID=2952536 RepID=UPI0020939C3C|nr:sensor histidine kinase [Actinoallomurus rhizosphaericola]MCO5996386.1 sensor histidine kinase [Actinoallomurus rhizosphaericola]